jgi:hypothetical protein
MTWIVPLALSVLLGLIAHLVWRKITPEGDPDYEALMPLMLFIGSSVIWGLFGIYHLNNWFWGFYA